MNKIRTIDIRLLDDIFDMGGGYVLDFSDRTFAAFFLEKLNIDITDQRYYLDGTSKAKRLRCFFRTVDSSTAALALRALWDYREEIRQRANQPEKIVNAHSRFLELLNRLKGTQPAAQPAPAAASKSSLNREAVAQLKAELLAVASMAPQARGYAYEKFLKKLFDTYGLEARQAFRLQGEQIDGSFQLGHETYLLEAKWQGLPIGAADLYVFQGKIGEKASWARGLFVSDSGFTPEGLAAFGKGKSVVCLSGLDLYDMLDREISLNHVLERKVRRAAETGFPFIQVRDLFP